MAADRLPLFPSRQSSRRFLTVLSSCVVFSIFIVGLSVAAVYVVDLLVFRPFLHADCAIFDKECQMQPAGIVHPLVQQTDSVVAKAVSNENMATAQATMNSIEPIQPLTRQTGGPKIAFLFMSSGLIPLERLWARFFQGHEGEYSIYVHSSDIKAEFTEGRMATNLFVGRQIPTQTVVWGDISTVDVERRLVSEALRDLQNQYFVLLSETSIPIRSFRFIRTHLLESKYSFVDCKEEIGPEGDGRWVFTMLPEIPREKFRKGNQWFAIHRRHASAFTADEFYYEKFRDCHLDDPTKKCHAEEHYLQTFLSMMDTQGITNYSVMYVDWSGPDWKPREFHGPDITAEFLTELQNIVLHDHPRPDGHPSVLLFAEQFHLDSLEALLNHEKTLFSS